MEEMYYYWLHNVSGIGRVTLQNILKITTPEELYKCNLEKTSEFLTDKQREALKESIKQWNVVKEWEKIEKRNIKLLRLGDNNYPGKLSKISDPPVILYQKGKDFILDKPSVAVIGARACSQYGSLAAKELGRELAHMGIVVVSGMARGIDGICQWAALENQGESIGVLGSGVEVCYPPENRTLYEKLQIDGCIISENPPFMQPNARLFPLRNRIISGLADIIVVVESREKSGTLITVDMALEQGKEVYAMPGRMTDPVSRGCNKLIKQGAGVVLSPREFVEEISPILIHKYQNTKKNLLRKEKYSIEGKDTLQQTKKNAVLQEVQNAETIWGTQVTKEEQIILKVLNVSLKNIEEIYQEAKKEIAEITLSKVMEVVLGLQLKNILKEENGYYGVNVYNQLITC